MAKKKPAPAKRKRGRPSRYTPELAAKLCERLIKTGTRLVSHGRYAIFRMAAAALPREVFVDILGLITTLRGPPGAVVFA